MFDCIFVCKFSLIHGKLQNVNNISQNTIINYNLIVGNQTIFDKYV